MRVFLISMFALSLGLVGCASEPPQIRHFVLTEPAFTLPESNANIRVAVGSIRLAEFLSGSSLVVEEAPNEMRLTRQHRWADRLEQQIERQFRQGMSQLMPNSQWVPLLSTGYLRTMDYRIDFYVDAFHLNNEGQARVRVQWFLRNTDEHFIQSGIADQQVAVEGSDYANLVSALSTAWHQALRDIATQIGTVNNE